MSGAAGSGVDAADPGQAWAFDFSGRTVVVTGGSRGLGHRMARAFSTLGARVVIASRKLDACEATAAAITAETGGEVHARALQVADWDACTAFAHEVWETFGGIDVLVNNAGSSPPYGRLSEISEALYDRVIGLNLKGPFRLAAILGERMWERAEAAAGGAVSAGTAAGGPGASGTVPEPASRRGGAILNISSTAAVHPRPHTVPYGAAKAGLNATTQALAAAYGPHVRVNAIVPGTFLTDVSAHWDAEEFARRAQTFAARRGGDPEEIVGAALYLCSDMAGYTTGSLLTVDGGAPA
ncbi:SDR family NAD(P)-dependent oxidoreductase [Brevibacterium album]|uniref:SDR family NAD(P)-dependent oxidoreductase n=1 Tax=Brevibacterium album TaxID=417948 RepID=UPI0004190093|nr:SDR family oxidoreductase [Brevibacterium album]